MTTPTIVSRDEWLAARLSLLEEEKRLIQMRDAVAETRQPCPGSGSTRTTVSKDQTARSAWPICSVAAAS